MRLDKEQRVLATARALGVARAPDYRPTQPLRIVVLTQPPRNPFHAALHEGIDNASRLHAALDLQFLVQHFDPKGPAAIAATVRVLSARLPVVT